MKIVLFVIGIKFRDKRDKIQSKKNIAYDKKELNLIMLVYLFFC